MEKLGIYLHIPFCRQKCGYCDFYSVAGAEEGLMDAYLEALTAQMGAFFTVPGSQMADTVYLGGGTPSVLGGRRLARLLGFLSRRVKLAHGCEITLEVNPESVDKGLLRAARKSGVNRISMGVQSADDGQLKALGRLHTFEQARAAAELVRRHCTDNLSIDLMYGLPGQSLESWQSTLAAALTLSPQHISCYALKLEPGTPLFDAAPDLPDDDAQAEMYLYAVAALARRGFEQYEISNFARPGRVSRHNSKYWDLSPYVGFGCGAHSFYGGRRFAAIADIKAFIAGVGGRGSVMAEADEAPFFGRVGEYLMLGLRTAQGLDEARFTRLFGCDFEPYARRLAPFVASGHAVRDAGRWRLTPEGFLVSNRIILALLEACEAGL